MRGRTQRGKFHINEADRPSPSPSPKEASNPMMTPFEWGFKWCRRLESNLSPRRPPPGGRPQVRFFSLSPSKGFRKCLIEVLLPLSRLRPGGVGGYRPVVRLAPYWAIGRAFRRLGGGGNGIALPVDSHDVNGSRLDDFGFLLRSRIDHRRQAEAQSHSR